MKFRHISTFLLLSFFVALTSQAQVLRGTEAAKKISGSEMVRISGLTGNPDYIKLGVTAEVPMGKSELWLRQVFHLENESSWNIIGEEKDELGETHYRCQQTWKGVPIRDAIFILHTRNENIYSVNGTLFSQIQPANQVVLAQSQALAYAKKFVGATEYMWEKPQEEARLRQMTGKADATYLPEGKLVLLSDKKTNTFQYAWAFDLYATKPVSRQEIFADAANGAILLSLNKINTTDVPGTAVTKFSGTKTITTDQTGPSAYRLRETGRGNGIQTYDMNQGTDYASAVDFTDSDNYWNNVNTEMDEVAGDAHWGSEMTYDFFWLKQGRNSIDDNGFALISYVHYDNAFANAYWDGTCMTYGDGDGSTYQPFTALDIIGHEITHGMTTFTANLDYVEAESGSLNEGFSDIFGTCIEFYAKPTLANWTCGEDIGVIIRSLSDPNSSGNPDTYLGTNWDPAQEMHNNSTICSHWFYRLAMGGVGTNDNGDAYNVVGQGIDTAAKIAFRTLTVYLTNSSDFADARFYAIVSAADLYGGCSDEAEATADAWYAVGVGTAYNNEVLPEFTADYTIACSAPIDVNFQNLSFNANTYLWRFGDGATSTLAHPSHTYASQGNYTVQLIANGGAMCGTDSITKTSYISIATNNTAIASLPASGAGMTQTCCSGTLTDNGGSGEYSSNTESTLTITPTGAMSVTLTFASFDMETGWDYLYVYDGPTTASPLIGQYDGASLPNGGSITSSGNSITLRQTSDLAVVGSGFEASWLCNIPNAAPITTFTADVTETCTGIIQFTDHSSNGPASWLWEFGDGSTSLLQNPLHTYTSSGTYNVKLRSGNGFGNDSLIRSSYISVALPASPLVTPGTTCDSSTAILGATGSGQLDWYGTATGGTLLGSGNSFTTPILYNSATYYVEDNLVHASLYGGKTDNSGTGSNFTSTTNIHYQIFDCYVPLTLVSVKVYANGTANRNIQLRDSAMNVLESVTLNIPDGTSRVTLNFDVPVQNKLQLVGNGGMDLFRNNEGSASYPYTMNGMLSITESSASLPPYNVMGNYYYFYDWEVQEPNCISARVPVIATVEQCNGLEENAGLNAITVGPNPTNGMVNIEIPASEDGNISLQILDLTGRMIAGSEQDLRPGLNQIHLDLSTYAAGVYYLKLTGFEGKRVVKIVKSAE